MYLIFKYHSFKRIVNEIVFLCNSGTETRLSLPQKKKKCTRFIPWAFKIWGVGHALFPFCPLTSEPGGYKPSINTPRSDPTQLQLPSSPWLQALRNIEQIFRSRFPRFRVWLIAVQCMAARDHVPRIYPPTSILVVGLNLTLYSQTSIALCHCVTGVLKSVIEVRIYEGGLKSSRPNNEKTNL